MKALESIGSMKRKTNASAEELSKKKKSNPSKVLPTQEEQRLLQQFDSSSSNRLLLSTQSVELIDTLSSRTESLIPPQQLSSWLDGFKRDLSTTGKHSCNGRVISGEWVSKQNFQGLTSFYSNEIEIEYKSPSLTEVVGSYATATLTPPFLNVDVLVTIPQGIIEER